MGCELVAVDLQLCAPWPQMPARRASGKDWSTRYRGTRLSSSTAANLCLCAAATQIAQLRAGSRSRIVRMEYLFW